MIMKNAKQTLLFLAVGLAIIFVGAIILRVAIGPTKLNTIKPELYYTLETPKSSLKVGEKFKVNLFLDGTGVGQVNAYDLRLYYDKSKLSLENATPGNFFPKYITAKWDNTEPWFAMALSPGAQNMSDTVRSPLMTLEFKALAKVAETELTTTTTVVYVSNTGAFHPKTGNLKLSIR
jgi:hypothetical protein